MHRGFTAFSKLSLSLLLVFIAVAGSQSFAHPRPNGVTQSNFTGQITGVRKILDVTHEPLYQGLDIERLRLVFDDQFAYLSTANGLFRTSRTLSSNSSLTLLGFADRRQINNLYDNKNVLYVLKTGGDPRSNNLDAHSFLKSTDHGQTFVPLDERLTWCYTDYCEYMRATHALFRDDLIFLAVGGGNNFAVSRDEGKNWNLLYGYLEPAGCSEAPFEIIGNKVLFGGECPLDFAYLMAGTLRQDMLGWMDSGMPREVMGLDELENRNVQFVKHSPNTSFVFAGVEGGLLKSSDLGETYEFKIKHPMSGSAKYPYIHEVLLSTRYRDFIIVGGFDKPGQKAYLAYSQDHGESWTDISHLLQTPEYSAFDVAFITEDPQGRILIGFTIKNEEEFTIAEVMVTAPVTLLTEGDQDRALALDSVTFMRGPFSPFSNHNFSVDGRTCISLFATNIQLTDENVSAITAQAEDSAHKLHQLPVEYVGKTPDFPWLTTIVVRLPDELANAGDVRVSIAVRGVESNKALLSIHSAP
jgi:hypothetical protein